MKVGVIQSSFIPWRGYFDFIASVDAFVFLEDVQYTSCGWRNRNKIKTPKGTEWVTIPVMRGGKDLLIRDAKIDCSQGWIKRLQGSWTTNYGRSEFFNETVELLAEIETTRYENLSSLNIELTKRICDYLSITTPLIDSSDLSLEGTKTDRLIDLLKKLNATSYLSGPSADVYLDKEAFRRNGIRLEYKSYDYEPYPQLWGPFEGTVMVLDLIANCGPDAKNHIRSRTPDKVIIE
ncbi:MAG: WbqC family protein [Piscirickettsiaceae bacterium]|jgi:hypothetical protein|nr:WbqC family protein [Piscirickettsiaceae bacterium]